jgi:hypothetical protein
MKSLSTFLLATLFIFLLNGCGIGAIASMMVTRGNHTMPAYTIDKENQAILTQLVKEGYHIKLTPTLPQQESNQTVHCRLMTSITPPQNQTYQHYLYHAFLKEFQTAHLYEEKSQKSITITLQELKGSSLYGDASWFITIEINSNNGKKHHITSIYKYDSSFRASSACKDMKKTFPLALQKLIHQTLIDPQFKAFLEKKRESH